MNHLNLEEFERKIAYTFSDKNLLILALTHSSYANETKKGSHENNERLEFLGDAVLDMVVSEYMYRHFPMMPEGELTKLRAAVCAAAAPAVPVHDTIKLARDRRVTETPDRSMLFAVQTPQVFDAGLLKAALQSALTEHAALTDDCSAVERLGKAVYLTDGDEENIKITTPLDLIVAETILRRREEREAEE